MRRASLALLTACVALSCARSAPEFSLVIAGGRVIDPESGLDAIRNLGIRGDTIVRVSAGPLVGSRTIDASGLVVAPGFIDLHSHVQTQDGYRLMTLEGVTAALDLEGGVPDLARFVAVRQGKSPIHFGAAASFLAARSLAFGVPLGTSGFGPQAGIPTPPAGPVTNAPTTPEERAQLLKALRSQIDAGALGVGLGLEYAPGTTRHEVIDIFRLAASYRIPVYIHARSAGRIEPGSSIESVGEAIADAAITGASVHIVHLNSTCLRDAPECLSMIAGARARGLDVTTEGYPYTAGMTYINSALFNPGWRERRGLDYGDIELPESGERLTQQRFDALHASPEPRLVLIHMNPDAVVDAIITDSLVSIGSDALATHPRAAGAFARILARYAREQRTLTINEAIRKMSLMPARRLETAMPTAKRMGRIQEGMQADVAVFDPQAIQDRATFREPSVPSVGIRYLVVAGTVVVDQGKVVEGAAPGRALLRGRNPPKP